MKKNSLVNKFELYKKAIRIKYEEEKKEMHSDVFIKPSRAKLRDFCGEIFKNNHDKDDLMCFAAFFGFEFNPQNINKLKSETDRFRPIENFFKGETDLTDLKAINLAAILVNLRPRPYLKFKMINGFDDKVETEVDKENTQFDEKIGKVEEEDPKVSTVTPIDERIITIKRPSGGKIGTSRTGKPINNYSIGFGIIFVVLLLSSVLILYPKKQCMQWQNDHYELVDCEAKEGNPVIVLDKSLLNFKKVSICDTTIILRNNKPLFWYGKNGSTIEFFNSPGNGTHPENEKPLKPLTKYTFDKYISTISYISKNSNK